MYFETTGIKIAGHGAALPNDATTNFQLWPETSNWVENVLGILERRRIREESELIDLSALAAKNALDMAAVSIDQVDCVIVATSTPDYLAPSMATILHGRLGAPVSCAAFDLQAVCAGFVHAFSVAASFLNSSNAKNILIIGADQFSKITNYDKRDCVFFGDASAAMLLQKSNSKNRVLIELNAEGSGWQSFHVPRNEKFFNMNAREVYLSATDKLPKSINELCSRIGLEPNQIKHFFTHQPSKPVLDALELNLNLSNNQLHRNIKFRGNTAGATVPLVYSETIESLAVRNGDWICFAAIGAGWTWGTILMEWVE